MPGRWESRRLSSEWRIVKIGPGNGTIYRFKIRSLHRAGRRRAGGDKRTLRSERDDGR